MIVAFAESLLLGICDEMFNIHTLIIMNLKSGNDNPTIMCPYRLAEAETFRNNLNESKLDLTLL